MVSEVSSEVLKLSVQGPAWAGGADPSRALPANVGLSIPHLGAFTLAAILLLPQSSSRSPSCPSRKGWTGGGMDRQIGDQEKESEESDIS